MSYTRGVQVIEWLFERKALLPFSRSQRDELAREVDRIFDNRDSQFAVASIGQDNILRELAKFYPVGPNTQYDEINAALERVCPSQPPAQKEQPK